jgi:hypothetical protein
MTAALDCPSLQDLEAMLRATFSAERVPRAELFARLNVHVPIERNILVGALGPDDPWPVPHIARVLWARSNHVPDADHVSPGAHRPAGPHGSRPPAGPAPGIVRDQTAPLARPAGSDPHARISRLVQLATACADRLAAVDPESPETVEILAAWREFARKGGR